MVGARTRSLVREKQLRGRHRPARQGWVYEWGDELIDRVTPYIDIDEARAAAERLAQERADG